MKTSGHHGAFRVGLARRAERSVLVEAALGALAGVAAGWAMGQATSLLYARQSEDITNRENEVRDGKMAYGVAAEKAAELAGKELSDEQRKQYGSYIHQALGLGAGAAYGVLRDHLPGPALVRGLLFGAGFFLLVDEAGNTVLGLTPPPQEFPWQTHGRGLVGHLVFGLAMEACFELFDAHAAS